ncbi:MAG: hypothetical protein CMQ41_04425 [Gammaproteobacteria bacterium]|nr:hypothetical protein [Gammaproteobacteria bacterium]|tara:strand:+ start:629 stop:1114 length:486 start_codon:yes stop_codon:yes gene_type:complete
MKKPDINTLIQLLGLIGVAASLIFVGLELRQSQTIAIAGQVQARNQAFLDLYTSMMGEEPIGRALLADGFATPNSDPTNLSEEEYDIWNAFKSWQVMSLQNAFQQYEMGLLPETVWEQVSSRIQNQYANCFSRQIFLNTAIPSLSDYLQTLSQDCAMGTWD